MTNPSLTITGIKSHRRAALTFVFLGNLLLALLIELNMKPIKKYLC